MLNFTPCLTCDRRQRPPANGKCLCLADPHRRDITLMVQLGTCPHPGGPRLTPAGPTEAGSVSLAPSQVSTADRGRALWAELHRRALAADNVPAYARWVRESFGPRVPCGSCKRSWAAIVDRMPPEAATGPFNWSVAAHNAVNAELGKPLVAVDEARLLWAG